VPERAPGVRIPEPPQQIQSKGWIFFVKYFFIPCSYITFESNKKDMKNLIAFLAIIFLTLSVKAQTTLETAVLKELNSYRTGRGHCTLKIEPALSVWSAYHAKYLTKLNEIGAKDATHDEKIDIPNWRELTFAQRDAEFNKAEEDSHIGKGEVQTRSTIPFKPGTPEKDIAKRIIDGFDNSPLHNEIINSDYDENDLAIVGISVIKNKDQVGGYDVYTVVIDLGVKFK